MIQFSKIFNPRPASSTVAPASSTPVSTRDWSWIDALPLDDFICLAYAVTVGRVPGAAEIAHHHQRLLAGRLERRSLFRNLLESEEYEKSLNPLHHLRKELVRRLPAAQVIVDLGGSTPHFEAGALYFMGYQPWAQRLIIVDLPPQERFDEWRKTQTSERPRFEHEHGVVEYAYGSISDLSFIAESGFADLVWSGNAIEHVTETEADGMIAGAWRLLKPGGQFCLDTPNRNVTRVFYPQSFCHPDHKLEYTDAALSAKLEAAGFVIEERLGVMDCGGINRRTRIDLQYMMTRPVFTPRIDDGFLLYYRCRKPLAAH